MGAAQLRVMRTMDRQKEAALFFFPFPRENQVGETLLRLTFGLPGLTDTGPPTSLENGDEAESAEPKVSRIVCVYACVNHCICKRVKD